MTSNIEDFVLEQLLNEDVSDTDINFLFTSSSDESTDFRTDSSEADDSETSVEYEHVIKRRKLNKVENYVEVILPSYDDILFKEHFRMCRATCYFVINKVTNAQIFPTHSSGRAKISPEKAFLMTLWYLTNQESYRQVSERFNIAMSAAHRCINIILNYLVQISNQYIMWPQGETREEIALNFAKQHNIRGVIGAIDACHINIIKPEKDQHVYCNRNGQYSILVQGVCDDKKRFIDVFCGEAGSINDATLLQRSTLYELITDGNINLDDYFLLGDSAYPNLSWLIPPFEDNGILTDQHNIFNDRHSSARIVIEHTFGLLKGRFRRLKNFENRNINFITKAVISACVLHNICINLDDLDIDYEQEINIPDNFDNTQLVFNNNIERRQQIFNEMFSVN